MGRLYSALTILLLVIASWLVRLPRGPGAGTQNFDVDLYFYPLYEATYRRLASGVLPTWNPWQLCGIPWLATLQAGVFYPFHALYLVLPLHVGLALSNGTHLAIASLATAAFARRAGLSTTAATLAALLVGMRGMLAAGLAAPSYLEAAAWLPVGAIAVWDLGAGRWLRGMALLAAATALSFLAGYPQPTTYMLLVWASLVVAAAVAEGGGFLRAIVAFGIAVAIGAMAAGIQLAPALELIRDGAHRELSRDAMSPLGMSPAAVMLATSMIAGGVSSYAWGVAALALAGVALAGRRTRILAVWAAVMTALTVLGALGDQTPLFRLYRAVPLLASFRFPDRMLGMTDFTLAILVAIGLDALTDRAASAVRRRATTITMLAASALVLALAWTGGAPREQLPHVVVAAIVAVALACTALRAPGAAAVGLVVLVAVELFAQPWRHLVTYTSATVERYGRFAPEYRTLAERAGPDRVWFVSHVGALRPERALKLAMRYGVRTIDDYEPLAPRRQAEYFTFFGEGTTELHRPPWLFAGEVPSFEAPPGVPPLATRRRLLDLTATRYVVVPAGLPRARPEIAAFLRDAGFVPAPPLAREDPAVFENPHVLPRAFVVYRTRPAPDTPTLLATLARDEFDPLVESWVEGGAPTDGPRGAPARIVVDEEHAVEIEATLAQPGLVVLADAYYPGWRATVDGTSAPIVATNHLFRGVPVFTGTHRVRLEYRPASVVLGALASIAGWMSIAMLAWRARR